MLEKIERLDMDREALMHAQSECWTEDVLEKLEEALVLCRYNQVKEIFRHCFTEEDQRLLTSFFCSEEELINHLISHSDYCLYFPDRNELFHSLWALYSRFSSKKQSYSVYPQLMKIMPSREIALSN